MTNEDNFHFDSASLGRHGNKEFFLSAKLGSNIYRIGQFYYASPFPSYTCVVEFVGFWQQELKKYAGLKFYFPATDCHQWESDLKKSDFLEDELVCTHPYGFPSELVVRMLKVSSLTPLGRVAYSVNVPRDGIPMQKLMEMVKGTDRLADEPPSPILVLRYWQYISYMKFLRLISDGLVPKNSTEVRANGGIFVDSDTTTVTFCRTYGVSHQFQALFDRFGIQLPKLRGRLKRRAVPGSSMDILADGKAFPLSSPVSEEDPSKGGNAVPDECKVEDVAALTPARTSASHPPGPQRSLSGDTRPVTNSSTAVTHSLLTPRDLVVGHPDTSTQCALSPVSNYSDLSVGINWIKSVASSIQSTSTAAAVTSSPSTSTGAARVSTLLSTGLVLPSTRHSAVSLTDVPVLSSRGCRFVLDCDYPCSVDLRLDISLILSLGDDTSAWPMDVAFRSKDSLEDALMLIAIAVARATRVFRGLPWQQVLYRLKDRLSLASLLVSAVQSSPQYRLIMEERVPDNLIKLLFAVLSFGGYDRVTHRERWSEVAQLLGEINPLECRHLYKAFLRTLEVHLNDRILECCTNVLILISTAAYEPRSRQALSAVHQTIAPPASVQTPESFSLSPLTSTATVQGQILDSRPPRVHHQEARMLHPTSSYREEAVERKPQLSGLQALFSYHKDDDRKPLLNHVPLLAGHKEGGGDTKLSLSPAKSLSSGLLVSSPDIRPSTQLPVSATHRDLAFSSRTFMERDVDAGGSNPGGRSPELSTKRVCLDPGPGRAASPSPSPSPSASVNQTSRVPLAPANQVLPSPHSVETLNQPSCTSAVIGSSQFHSFTPPNLPTAYFPRKRGRPRKNASFHMTPANFLAVSTAFIAPARPASDGVVDVRSSVSPTSITTSSSRPVGHTASEQPNCAVLSPHVPKSRSSQTDTASSQGSNTVVFVSPSPAQLTPRTESSAIYYTVGDPAAGIRDLRLFPSSELAASGAPDVLQKGSNDITTVYSTSASGMVTTTSMLQPQQLLQQQQNTHTPPLAPQPRSQSSRSSLPAVSVQPNQRISVCYSQPSTERVPWPQAPFLVRTNSSDQFVIPAQAYPHYWNPVAAYTAAAAAAVSARVDGSHVSSFAHSIGNLMRNEGTASTGGSLTVASSTSAAGITRALTSSDVVSQAPSASSEKSPPPPMPNRRLSSGKTAHSEASS